MGADNWANCPKCKKLWVEKLQEAEKALSQKYGIISAEEFLSKKEDLDARKRLPTTNSLREDYELGTLDDGQFRVSYRCSCEACGFNFSYKYDEWAC